MLPRRRPTQLRYPGPGVRFPLLAALLAVLLQAFAIQTHIHVYAPLGAGYAQSETTPAAPGAAHVSSPGHAASCIFCDSLAASRAALPSAPDLTAERQGAVETTVLAIAQAPQRPAHAWQSRAPPFVL